MGDKYINPKSIISENIKMLRTNLQYCNVDNNIKTMMVTSSVPGEGKSFVSSNLAISFGNLGKRTLLVDCDMRRGTQHKLFSLTNVNGLSDLLLDRDVNYEKYFKPSGTDNVFVVTYGETVPMPSELLSSKSFDRFVAYVKEHFDVIIFDAPPITLVPDASVIATKVDETLLVARINVTPIEELNKSKKMLENLNAKIAGVVVNGVKVSKKKYYSKYYN